MRGYGVQFHPGPNLTAEQIEQDDNSLVACCVFETADMVDECAGHNLHGSAFFEGNLPAGKRQTAFVFRVAKVVDHASLHRDGTSIIADQMGYPDS